MSEHSYEYIHDKELFLMRFYHYCAISQMWILASSWQKKTEDIFGVWNRSECREKCQ